MMQKKESDMETDEDFKAEMLNWSKVKLRDEAWFQNERANIAEKRIKELEDRILKMRELLNPLKSLIGQSVNDNKAYDAKKRINRNYTHMTINL